ncbi:MAG TPA: ABC transporter permease subunit/CPBP intramembrane protease [Planctomycetia bacterium]|nr:ABC transporter permease subunit/CPBP intramembrane protease [Planctomycetia bacterium]
MKLPSVWLIVRRELRDQLRDRRTLFLVFGMPVLLYPLLGFAVLQVIGKFESGLKMRVGVVGRAHLPAQPLFLDANDKYFAAGLFAQPERQRRFEAMVDDGWTDGDLRSGRLDALVGIPEGAAATLAAGGSVTIDIRFNGADQRSVACYQETAALVDTWGRLVADDRLARLRQPADYFMPVRRSGPETADVATRAQLAGALWGRLLPFILTLMALTGAFYPAVDLCAGEKERGTLETLLVSPAGRREIVVGKFLAVWAFSVATTAANLVSLGVTFSVSRWGTGPAAALARFGAPPLEAILGVFLLMLLPTALFSAWCLAISAYARGTKEGQYYLMPLFLVVTPLALSTASPAVSLSAATCLVPVANVALLVRETLAGDTAVLWTYLVPVIAPTLVYVGLALGWAVRQFEREEVLFREAEKIEPGAWLARLLRAKEPTPEPGEAMFAYALMLGLSCYFWAIAPMRGMGEAAIGMAALVLFPPLAWSMLLTSHARRSLGLMSAPWTYWGAAVAIPFLLHPVLAGLELAARRVTPPSPEMQGVLLASPTPGAPWWLAFLLLAVLRAICEEIAFRGFLLTGLAKRFPAAMAILLAATAGALFHLSLWQAPSAVLAGIFWGLLATRSGSVLPAILAATIHYSLLLPYAPAPGPTPPPPDGAMVFASALGAVILGVALARKPTRIGVG